MPPDPEPKKGPVTPARVKGLKKRVGKNSNGLSKAVSVRFGKPFAWSVMFGARYVLSAYSGPFLGWWRGCRYG